MPGMRQTGPQVSAWLIYDEERAARNRSYIQMHQEAGAGLGIRFQLLFPDEAERLLHRDPLPELPDFAIVRTICPRFSEELERFGIPVFNPASVSRICNDKGKTIEYVKANSNVPVIPTERYDNRDLSGELLSRYTDHVIKAVDGHGGRQVFRTSDPYPQIRQGIASSDFVVQPFIRGEGRDVRVYVIGREIVGAVERTSPDGFRSNFSLGGMVRSYPLDREEKRLVETVCRLFEFGLAGIDFILDEKGAFCFNEIEDVVGARMLYQCQPDVKLLERYFAFILDKILHCH